MRGRARLLVCALLLVGCEGEGRGTSSTGEPTSAADPLTVIRSTQPGSNLSYELPLHPTADDALRSRLASIAEAAAEQGWESTRCSIELADVRLISTLCEGEVSDNPLATNAGWAVHLAVDGSSVEPVGLDALIATDGLQQVRERALERCQTVMDQQHRNTCERAAESAQLVLTATGVSARLRFGSGNLVSELRVEVPLDDLASHIVPATALADMAGVGGEAPRANAWAVGPVGSVDERLARWASLDPSLASQLSLVRVGPLHARLVAREDASEAAAVLGERAQRLYLGAARQLVPIHWVKSENQRAFLAANGEEVASLSPGTPFVIASHRRDFGRPVTARAWSAIASGRVATAGARLIEGCLPEAVDPNPFEWLAVPSSEWIMFARSQDGTTALRIHEYRGDGCDVGRELYRSDVEGRLLRADLTRTSEEGGRPVAALVVSEQSGTGRRIEVRTIPRETGGYQRRIAGRRSPTVLLETSRRSDGAWIPVAVRDETGRDPVVLEWREERWRENGRRALGLRIP